MLENQKKETEKWADVQKLNFFAKQVFSKPEINFLKRKAAIGSKI